MSRNEHRVEQLRVPPQSVEAEQAVLGGLLLDWRAFPRVAELLGAEDFYRRDHQLIFDAISGLAEKNSPYDAITVMELLDSNGLSEQFGNGAYLIELASTTASSANIRAYAEIVRDKAKLRQLIDAGTQIVSNAFQPEGRTASELAAEANAALITLAADKSAGGPKSVKEVGMSWYSELQWRYENPGVIRGILTPWTTLNDRIVSLEPGHLCVVAGRPSMGKSAWAVSLALHAGNGDRDKGGVLYFDLESTGRAIFNRAVAASAGVPLRWLRQPVECDDSDEYWAKVARGVASVRKADLRIDDTPALTVQRIVARARLAYQSRPYSLLVIDHLHLIPLPGKTRETVEIGHITAALKMLAKELDITVVLLSQLNRSVEARADKRPTMADLRESGNIEQDADVILLLYRDDYYADRENRASRAPGLLEIIVAKQREGEVGTSYARAELQYARLPDITREEVGEVLGRASSPEHAPKGAGGYSQKGSAFASAAAKSGHAGEVPA